MQPHRTRRTQRGTSLLQALVAFLVLSLGLLSVAKLQSHLRSHADTARQRTEAVRLAQQEMESMRAFATLESAPGLRSYADIAASTTSLDATQARSNAGYAIERRVAHNANVGFKTATVTVNWADRAGTPREVVLDSAMAGSDPALSGALAMPAVPGPAGAFARSAGIPLGAKDLGDGRSVFKPSVEGTVAWVFDNASARVVARCTVAPHMTTHELTLGHLGNCGSVTGFVLSGTVRVSLAAPPDPSQADDPPLPVAVHIALAGGPYPARPECWSQARDRFVAYHCVVVPLEGRWSGRSSLVPHGWAIGHGPTEFKVCRYAADQDGSGAVDRNREHPDHYSDVDGPLMQQNFLIVRGPEACPTTNRTTEAYADAGTVQHQP